MRTRRALFGLAAGRAMVGQDDDLKAKGLTNGRVNGRLWRMSSPDLKLGYSSGYPEAFSLAESLQQSAGCTNFATFSKLNFVNRELVEAMDSLYSETANLRIPQSFGVL